MRTRSWMALTALALVVLQACGPGVGGSGTGQGLDAFGASAAPLCGSEIASALACPAGTAAPGASASAGASGTDTVYFADTLTDSQADTGGSRVTVTVQGDSIALDAPCAGLRFRGQWGLLAGQAARFYGLNGDGASAQPAQLRASLDGGGLLLTLLDANGNLLLGPVRVTVRPTAAAPGAC
jgi:hypothetical protein